VQTRAERKRIQVLYEALPDAGFATAAFLLFGGHAQQGQHVGMASHEPVQVVEHDQRVGAVSLDAFVAVVQVARADDVIGRARR
jgi:hypothetical protein